MITNEDIDVFPPFKKNLSGCYLSEKTLTKLYGHLFNAINPQIFYSGSATNMIEDAFAVTQNNLKYLVAIIQAALPPDHPLQDEMQMLLSAVEEKTSKLPPIHQQSCRTH